MSKFAKQRGRHPHSGRLMALCVFAFSIGSTLVATPVARANDNLLNLRSEERGSSSQKDEKKSPNVFSTITVYSVATPRSSTYRLDEESARDAMTAYAIRDELATITKFVVPADFVWVGEDDCLTVLDACPI